MPSSLTATKIKDTYGQVLHVDGGVNGTAKTVYDGDGTATALKVSTTDVQVNNSPVLTDADIGSTVQAYDADLTAWSGKTAPNGTVVGTTDTQTLSSKTFSDNPTFSAGTANSVAYLNGSKVLTTGSALTFDGANLVTIGTLTAGSAIASNDGTTISRVVSAGGISYWGTTTNHPVVFQQNNSEQMRLTSTGLGIGTSSFSTKLAVVGGRSRFQANNETYSLQLEYGPGTGQYYIGATNAAEPDLVFSNAVGAEKLRLDYSGNLGLGVTPSAWDSLSKAFQNSAGSIYTYSSDRIFFGQNVVLASPATDKYVANGYASTYRQYNGTHAWFTAPSGTAGNAISFTQAMTLDASGNLGIGVAPYSADVRLVVSKDQNTLTYCDFANTYNGASAGVLHRLITQNVAGSGTTSVDIIKYKTGTFAIYNNESNAAACIAFGVGASERMRIDSDGNVGIGNTNPSFPLDVSADTNSQAIKLRGRVSDNYSSIVFDNNSGNAGAQVNYIQGIPNSALLFATNNAERMRIDSSGTAILKNNPAGNALQFYGSGGSENARLGINASNGLDFAVGSTSPRMTIDSSGNLLVGTTSVIGYGKTNVAFDQASSWGMALKNTNATATGAFVSFVNSGGTTQGGIVQTNSTTTAYNTSSDYRLKENVKPIQNALATVNQLNPVTYTWKADGSDGQGFIAHELQAVVPDCVTGEKDAVDAEGKPVYQGVDTSFLVATLTAAIKELKAELDATKAEVAALKAGA